MICTCDHDGLEHFFHAPDCPQGAAKRAAYKEWLKGGEPCPSCPGRVHRWHQWDCPGADEFAAQYDGSGADPEDCNHAETTEDRCVRCGAWVYENPER